MGKPIRKVAAGVFVVVCVLICLLVASAVWDYNESKHDQKMMSRLIYDCLQTFNQDGDPGAIIFSYVGSTKTKVFHYFVSDCAREIRSTQLTGFDSKEDAVKAGYSQCAACNP